MVLSDWSHDATTFEIIDCRFSKDWQNQELLRLANAPIDAVISLPIGASGVLEGHRAVVNAGKKLVLLDNAPSGLRPGVDYLSVSSADNFGIGAIDFATSSQRGRRGHSHVRERFLCHKRT